MQKLKILLDLDNTSLFYNTKGDIVEHPRLQELISTFDVTLYSARSDIATYGRKWNVPTIWKGNESYPSADVLIDDNETTMESVSVRDYYESIDDFFASR